MQELRIGQLLESKIDGELHLIVDEWEELFIGVKETRYTLLGQSDGKYISFGKEIVLNIFIIVET